ncbi:MAG: hypothetical protein RR626_09180, partial [Anaerovoracaceae bacterium]
AETVDADEALIAVITAAIAAYEAGRGVTADLVVKKISRIAGPSVAWSAAGRSECIDNRRI